MSGKKRPAYLTGKIGAVSAELCEQAKRNRKNQPCHDRHSSHNGARFKWLLRFAGGCVPLADHQGIDRLGQRYGC